MSSARLPKGLKHAATECARQLADRPDWLIAALQSERVEEALARHVPEFTAGTLRLVECRATRLFLKDTSGIWRGVYELTVAGRPGEAHRKVQIRVSLFAPWVPPLESTQQHTLRPFGSEAWSCYLPELRLLCEPEPPEAELAILPQLVDPEASRALLEASIRAGSPAYHDLRILACRPRVVNYKPGSRCTIGYTFVYAEEDAGRGWPTSAIAKVYRATKGEQAYEGMVALWRTRLSAGDIVGIAEPLAYVPEIRLLVQAGLPAEQSLEELLRTTIQRPTPDARARLERLLRTAAAGLAALHRSGVRTDASITWGERVTTIPEALERIASVAPGVAPSAQRLWEQLQALAATQPADPVVPSHGSFDPDQVLIAQDYVSFIDFDSFSMAEPALDVGHMRAAIMDSGMKLIDDKTLHDQAACKAYLDDLSALGEVFLSEYEAFAPISRPRLALWEAWDYLRDALQLWTKPQLSGAEAVVRILEYHLAGMPGRVSRN
jgi:hypothetical protein